MDYKIKKSSFLNSLLKRSHQTLFPHKDPIEFFQKASITLPEIIRKHQISIIWATFPPYCNLTLANKISNATGIPWLADFRDVYQFTDNLGSFFMKPIRLFYEKQILRSASKVISVSDGFAATLRARHNRDVAVIPNGFDPDIIVRENVLLFPKFEIVYTGGINLGNPDFNPLFNAIQLLCETGKMDVNDVLISFYGYGNERRLKHFFHHTYSKVIKNYGGVPREESLHHQRKALILLQTTAPGTGWMTSKIYEYLVARRPILAIPREVVSSFLCKIFIGQFFEERQVLTHFSYRA